MIGQVAGTSPLKGLQADLLHIEIPKFRALSHVESKTGSGPISYPESSGLLVSGWAPGETLENFEKNKIFGLAALF